MLVPILGRILGIHSWYSFKNRYRFLVPISGMQPRFSSPGPFLLRFAAMTAGAPPQLAATVEKLEAHIAEELNLAYGKEHEAV